MNKLTIHDGGNISVGIMPQHWEIDLPYNDEDVTKEEEIEFINSIKKLYGDYCEGLVLIWKGNKFLSGSDWIEIGNDLENEEE